MQEDVTPVDLDRPLVYWGEEKEEEGREYHFLEIVGINVLANEAV